MNKKEFKSWSTSFSANVLKLITILWASFMAYSAIIIAYIAITTGSLYEVGTLMTEVNHTFIASVVSILITRVVGNVFEYNEGGIFGKSIRKENEDDSIISNVSTGDMCDNDESDNTGNQDGFQG